MKLFISWSGPRSRAVAETLRDWIPCVIQVVQPWISASDIDKGARWNLEVATQLQAARVGVICLTSDNLNSPWILFETGALSKTLEKTFVCPYLLDIEPVDLQGPLAQFQATKAQRDDTRRLLDTINRALGDAAIDEKILSKQFDKWWPDLEKSLRNIPVPTGKPQPKRDEREILEELLVLVRSMSAQVNPTPEEYALLSNSIQKAFPNLGQTAVPKATKRIVEWMAESIIAGYQPAFTQAKANGSLDVKILSFSQVENKKGQKRKSTK